MGIDLRKLTKDDVLTFSKWWEQNKAVYEIAGVSKEVAHTIWSAATDAITQALKDVVYNPKFRS